MAEFYIGIDSGGTKTRARVWFVTDGKTVDIEGGPSNLCSSRAEDVKTVFRSIFSRIRDAAGDITQCMGVGIGAAGVSSPLARAQISACLGELLPSHVPVAVASDAQTALYGAVADGAGMLLIAGTGSICLGKDDTGREHKAGGWGHLIDDEGSGYAIGRDILSAAVRQLDGRGRATVLTELLQEEWKLCKCTDIVDYVYGGQNSKAGIAAIAPLLSRACAAGDELSWKIAAKAADGLMDLVTAVSGILGFKKAVLVLRGGILLNMDPVSDILKKEVQKAYPEFIIKREGKDALDGALYLIRKNADR